MLNLKMDTNIMKRIMSFIKYIVFVFIISIYGYTNEITKQVFV